MADPVAEKSTFLKMYMSSHPDTLVAYAKWYGKVAEPIASAEMTSISSKNMELTCTLKSGYKKTVDVPLVPPLSGYDDVKPRLLEMKSLAQEGLGMIKTPRITSFGLPVQATGTFLLVASLAYLTLSSKDNPSPYFTPARIVHRGIVATIVNWLAGSIFVAHIFETLYVIHLCRKHTGLLIGLGYTISTLVCGIPVLKDLRKRIQQARIDSVMKVE